jgi:TonB family protein
VGPALRKAPLPFTGTLVSAVLHVGVVVLVVLGAAVWRAHQPKIYVVNLVPAVAAVGAPQARPAALPPRTEEPAPAPPAVKPGPPELPQRPPELPARTARRDSIGLPDRTLPPRAPGPPRATDMERPQVASAAPLPAPVPPTPDAPRREATAPPPPPPGQPTGSVAGVGAVTLNVSDFPFAWYLQQVHRKVSEKWDGKALPGRQPVVVFEIGRDGQIGKLAVEKTSGNSLYDRAALRAIEDAKPFPPLPQEFKEPLLRVHLGFGYSG